MRKHWMKFKFNHNPYEGKQLPLTRREMLIIGDRAIFKQQYQLDKTQSNYRHEQSRKFSMPFTGEEDLEKLNDLVNQLSYTTESKKLNEGSYKGDLERLVDPELHIDQHRSKMGEDDDIIVVSFKVKGKEPAHDLMNFLETGYLDILDADVSPGEISPGNFLVFFELSRRSTAADLIFKIVEEVLNLTLQELEEWRFTYGAPEQRGSRRKYTTYPLTLENLKRFIPMSPKEYRETHEEPNPQDDDEIAAMKNIAGLPVNQTAPQDDEMDSLRVASGQL